jgi:hypothetical protein
MNLLIEAIWNRVFSSTASAVPWSADAVALQKTRPVRARYHHYGPWDGVVRQRHLHELIERASVHLTRQRVIRPCAILSLRRLIVLEDRQILLREAQAAGLNRSLRPSGFTFTARSAEGRFGSTTEVRQLPRSVSFTPAT